MAELRISKRVVDQTDPTDKEFVLWDSDLTGFGVRVRPNGAKSYVVVYRAGHGRRAPVLSDTILLLKRLQRAEV